MVPAEASRPNWATLASIGAIAYVTADVVHEALGHGTPAWLAAAVVVSGIFVDVLGPGIYFSQ
ncbi:MAG: hypothetical protein WA755_15150 [Candidatus Acidiferrales bacterium]